MIHELSKAKISLINSLSVKKHRIDKGLFVVEGDKIFEEAMNSGLVIKMVVFNEDKRTAVDSDTFEVYTTDEAGMKKISNHKTAPGILAVIEIPQYQFDIFSFKSKLTVAIEDIQDPGNLGTIMRICDWYGVENLVCSANSVDVYNPKVVQASMGAIFRVKVHYVDLEGFLSEYKTVTKQCVYGTFLDGQNIYKTDLPESALFVLGNEGNGISDSVASIVDERLFIPPFSIAGQHAESLNVSIAAAICTSEFRRRL
ncbi:MAG: RNA methyltransferase [Clostridia bacterium]|nr:RNA methyltransferase [Clostridia bacterium]